MQTRSGSGGCLRILFASMMRIRHGKVSLGLFSNALCDDRQSSRCYDYFDSVPEQGPPVGDNKPRFYYEILAIQSEGQEAH